MCRIYQASSRALAHAILYIWAQALQKRCGHLVDTGIYVFLSVACGWLTEVANGWQNLQISFLRPHQIQFLSIILSAYEGGILGKRETDQGHSKVIDWGLLLCESLIFQINLNKRCTLAAAAAVGTIALKRCWSQLMPRSFNDITSWVRVSKAFENIRILP